MLVNASCCLHAMLPSHPACAGGRDSEPSSKVARDMRATSACPTITMLDRSPGPADLLKGDRDVVTAHTLRRLLRDACQVRALVAPAQPGACFGRRQGGCLLRCFKRWGWPSTCIHGGPASHRHAGFSGGLGALSGCSTVFGTSGTDHLCPCRSILSQTRRRQRAPSSPAMLTHARPSAASCATPMLRSRAPRPKPSARAGPAAREAPAPSALASSRRAPLVPRIL